MRIRVGQEFPVRSPKNSRAGDFYSLSRGAYETGANLTRGIFYYKSLHDPCRIGRTPAILLYSDNLRGLSEKNPWLDVIDADNGYALYHGDNRIPGNDPATSAGNKKILEIAYQYVDDNSRILAPPMILFEKTSKTGKAKSYRRLAGYGIPRNLRIQSQMSKQESKRETFTNLVIELVLFSLTREDELFDWSWVDHRRDHRLTSEETLKSAPSAWQDWVKKGDAALETSRRRVFSVSIRSPKEQIENGTSDDIQLNQKIYEFFTSKLDFGHASKITPYHFEGLASWVTSRILGSSSSRGWVTPPVDGGIDFVSRCDLGSGFSKTTVVVLGQAKCIKPQHRVRGIDIARTVARLKRGWIGVVVTTGTFSRRVQMELLSDQYPVILVNGIRLAQEVREEMIQTGIELDHLLSREAAWYDTNQRLLDPERVAFGDHWGISIG